MAADGDAEAVLEAAKINNPDITKDQTQIDFIRQYTQALQLPLKDLVNFQKAIEGDERYVCNLLCQQHVMAGFWLHERVTPVDLIRYVFTATCYGFFNEWDALVALDGVLGKLGHVALAKLVALESDRQFVRLDLRDMYLSHEKELTHLKQLVLKAGTEPKRPIRSRPPKLEQVARLACERRSMGQ
jgi:hypothetical protein